MKDQDKQACIEIMRRASKGQFLRFAWWFLTGNVKAQFLIEIVKLDQNRFNEAFFIAKEVLKPYEKKDDLKIIEKFKH